MSRRVRSPHTAAAKADRNRVFRSRCNSLPRDSVDGKAGDCRQVSKKTGFSCSSRYRATALGRLRVAGLLQGRHLAAAAPGSGWGRCPISRTGHPHSRRRPSNSPQKIRSHVPKTSASSVEPPRRPLVTATTTSRPITRNTSSCVPLQVGVGGPFRPAQASSPVRLCWYWLMGAWGGQLFQPQLNPTSTAEYECCCGAACRFCTGKASTQQGAVHRLM
jgi:hypothetical protein